jgi:acyl carrier protein
MKEEIKEVLKKALNISEISDNISQQNCENWDSLRHLNLIVELEDEFGVSFEPEDIAEMKDIPSIQEKIEKLKA